LDWSVSEAQSSLNSLKTWADDRAQFTIDWYMREKRIKGRWSKALRVVAIVCTVVAALVPIAASQQGDSDILWSGYALLGVAASAIAGDRYFGLSSAWMRYMSTALALRRSADHQNFIWAKLQSESTSASADFQRQIDALGSYVDDVHRLMAEETATWQLEFQANLERLRAVTPVAPS
jgi:hypothetical protein